ncbi:MAG: flavodoxin family protein [Kiritimatiellia bacterium]
MKVLLINGSPNEKGCTFTALSEMAETLRAEGVETAFYHIGTDPITPCRACRACSKLGRCVISDKVNAFLEFARGFDGYVVGSPVHYASAAGGLVPFLDRAFFTDFMAGRNSFIHKPGCAIVSARRAGTTATLDQLNKYFQINQMPVVSGRYWNMVHGATPDEVRQDAEGMQNMRILARNMAYLLKCREAAEKAGIWPPEPEETVYTNFIR